MINLSNVSVVIEGNVILDKINFNLQPHQFVSLVGSTGSGKTTLFKLLYFDLLPTSGSVTVINYSSSQISQIMIPYLRRKLGIIFQDYKLLEDKTAYENVAFALYVTNSNNKSIQQKVMDALTSVGLSHKRNYYPEQLSGGEQQRIAIARAIVNEPFILLADEPTGNLDPQTSLDILNLLKEINKRGTAIFMATHNYDLMKKADGKIFQLKDKKLTEVQFKK
ncbi:MAG: ATP-binding cassette domain-containing protein [Bacteroidetes bacterium]|nr:ATP-binding cassette domain-containing protein [Bacteroidota bacterium]